MTVSGALLLLLRLVALTGTFVQGSYVILTPRQWTSEAPAQVCVMVDDPGAPSGRLTFAITTRDWRLVRDEQNVTVIPDTTLQVPAGTYDSCYGVSVPSSKYSNGALHVYGIVGGTKVNRTVNISLKRSNEINFLQSDKFLYEPGQNVKLRILSIVGADLSVSYKPYPEVWVTTPSKTRIAQWKNVDNTAGLVHLDFDLADEPEMGNYRIHVKTHDDRTEVRDFKVEEFVLPRFEVKLKTPSYILAVDEEFTFTVCANYTFGQPVKGSLSLTISNGKRKKCLNKVTNNVTISGCKDVKITSADMQIIDCNVYQLTANAIVTEEGTDVEVRANSRISITRNAVTFKTIYSDKYVKPNLPFTLKLRAELPDGSPAAGVPMEVCAAGRCTNMTTAPDGLFTTVLPSYNTNRVYMKALNCRANMHESSYSKDLEHYYSPSNSSLLIHAPEGKLKCVPGQTQQHALPVLFSARNQNTPTIYVQVVSRGKIQYRNSQKYQLTSGDLPISVEHLVEPLPPPIEGTVRGVVSINVNLPPTASPKAKVLVWYTREDGEVVADTRELEVEKCLGSSASLTWSESQAQPGQQTTLTLSSDPNSVCSLGVVDRSSELLATDPDPITLEKLFNFADDFDISPWRNSQVNTHKYCQDKYLQKLTPGVSSDQGGIGFPGPSWHQSYYSDYVDALSMFDNSGLYIFTDLTVETRPCEKEERHHYFETAGLPGFAFGGASGSAGNGGGGLGGPPPSPQASFAPTTTNPSASRPPNVESSVFSNKEDSEEVADSPRTNFPETWLWDIVVLPSSGVNSQDLTLPDTITQWVGKAVCVHPEKGVALSERESITTFTPFFVDLTLPPTVKRGEILPVKMSIFNYLDRPIPLSVSVGESAEYEIIQEPGAPGELGRRSSCLPAQDKVVHTVKIKPLVIGEVNITVSAFVDYQYSEPCGSGDTSIEKRDALIKPIKVEAEGFLKEETWTKYVCSKDLETLTDSLEEWELEAPPGIVEGSDRAWVTVVGDLLALSLENLGNLVRLPYGCGEQNMINFAPNIFIMRYLEASNQTTPETTRKLVTSMKNGYQRQLRYRRSDGSYSAFGNVDSSGSTWLTAFVLKSFAQAQDYIQIDKEGLNKTRDWLVSKQSPDGCFRSVGKVFNKALKGGIEGILSPVPLTAYVMIALLESDDESCNPSYCPAAQCVRSGTSRDPYTLALKAYALALAQLPHAESVLQDLLDQALVNTNSLYWKLPEGPGKSNAIGVETAGYVLLAMLTRSPKRYQEQSRKIVKWLTTQRNGQGGFYSTQDTVVALQALAMYESQLYQGSLNVVATVTATGLSHPFTVTDDNKLLQQLVTLPTLPTNVSVTVTGQGCAVLQAVLRYNVPEPEASKAFDMTVNTNTAPDKRCVTKRITVCTAYRLPDGKSNMAVIEVDLVSGYIPEKEDLKNAVRYDPNIKRYEVDGSKVSFYIEELTAQDTCANFRVIRVVDVEDVKPGTVRVYDYYQPEYEFSKSYTLPPPTECR